ncbi:phosphate transporter [Linnemannia schmuckeri]|uniref:Phosphate transporter n=1 Tax=Linnemannia schmuckeri TaxID=64567 RepID=A0A9P5S2J2_9FUNG|nr:phosphate transporter [Linnemannia schmuckeri]
MTPPLDTSTYFHSTYDIHYPVTLKIHNQQQQHLQQQQQPQNQSTIRALVDKSVLLVNNAYDLILLNLVVPLLSLIYFKHSASPPLPTGSTIHPTAANTVSFSTLIGQLFFGYLGGAYGRHKFYSLDLMIIIFGTLFCALSNGGGGGFDGAEGGGGGGGTAVIQYLTFWRFVLAFGVGGDYPISATVPSEQAVKSRRRGGQLIAILTSIQGLGNLVASMATLMVLIRFRAMIVDDDGANMDMVWRTCITVGCLPALSTALIRFTMPAAANASESGPRVDPQNQLDADLNVLSSDMVVDKGEMENNMSSAPNFSHPSPISQSASASAPFPEFPSPSKVLQRRAHTTRVFREYCSQWKNLKVLIGTSLSWFLLDIAFRSISLNQSYLFDILGMTYSSNNPQVPIDSTTIGNKTTLYRHLWMTTLGNLTISLLGIVPGYWFAIFSVEKIHRKRAQFLGFALLLFFFTLLSTAFHQLKAIVPLFITTFTLSQFFSNLTSSTPFVIPGEMFPTRVRTTAHGISAGFGKVGAVLATLMFNRLVEMDSPLSDLSKGTTVGAVFGVVVMTVGFLMVVFVFPRGTRRLLSSKLTWSRRSNSGGESRGSRVFHRSPEIDV